MSPALTSVIALQSLDTAADGQRKRLADLPAAEQALTAAVTSSRAALDALKTQQQDNTNQRRALEKEVAGVDSRLARFDDHKAAVKTNQEYTALLHEISTARTEKDRIEEQLLVLMEQADGIAAEVKSAERALADEQKKADAGKAELGAERTKINAELARLAAERSAAAKEVDPRTLALYEQLIKGRRGVAMAKVTGEICEACHVRLRPSVTQQVRRNDSVVQCDSCQRFLYYVPPAAGVAP